MGTGDPKIVGQGNQTTGARAHTRVYSHIDTYTCTYTQIKLNLKKENELGSALQTWREHGTGTE